MLQETAFTYPVEVTGNDFTEDGIVKPVFYQNSIQSVAERHLHALNLDTATMAEHQMAWVLVGMTIAAERPVLPSQMTLIGKTWHSQTKPPYFRREFLFENEMGEPFFYGVSFSVLLDLNSRKILRRFTLPRALGNGNGVFLLSESLRPTFRETAQYDLWGDRPVYNSYLDLLGHVNNTRYCEFAFDALTQEEKKRPIWSVALNFSSELRQGDRFEVHKGQVENTLFFKGIRTSDRKKSFDVAFGFEKPQGK